MPGLKAYGFFIENRQRHITLKAVEPAQIPAR